jgi:putative membrane protein
MMGNGMLGGGMWAAMGIWWFLAIALLIALLVLAVLGSLWLSRRIWREDEYAITSHRGDALDVLRRRYAAGEIDDDEFEHRRAALTRN